MFLLALLLPALAVATAKAPSIAVRGGRCSAPLPPRWRSVGFDRLPCLTPSQLHRKMLEVDGITRLQASEVPNEIDKHSWERLAAGETLRYMAHVMYDGADFNGFQVQCTGQRTVQGELEAALARRFQGLIRVVGASRTDAGVHARGQVVHFDLPTQGNGAPGHDPAALSLLCYSLNQMLPPDVRVRSVAPAPPPQPWQAASGQPWHANMSACAKLYTYRLAVSEVMNPLDARQRAHYTPLLWRMDMAALERSLTTFVGTHDFRAFSSKAEKAAAANAATGRGDLNTERTISTIAMLPGAHGSSFFKSSYLDVHFVLDGALYKMVRHVMGAAVAVAARRVSADTVAASLVTGEWQGSGAEKSVAAPAPACGLTLERVFYDEPEAAQLCQALEREAGVSLGTPKWSRLRTSSAEHQQATGRK